MPAAPISHRKSMSYLKHPIMTARQTHGKAILINFCIFFIVMSLNKKRNTKACMTMFKRPSSCRLCSDYCLVTVALRVFTLNVPSDVFTLYTPFLAETSLAVIPIKEKLPSSFRLML